MNRCSRLCIPLFFLLCSFILYSLLSISNINSKTKDNIDMNATNNQLNSITYINISNNILDESYSFIPVSYIKDGVQTLTGTSNTYSYLSKNILQDAPSPADLDLHFYPFNDSNPYIDLEPIASNGLWEFFPQKVTYEKYCYFSQPNQKAWENYFRNQLDKALISSPVVIAESWTFNWEGIETIIVTASNVIADGSEDIIYLSERYPDPTPLPINQDNSSMYIMTAIFLGDNPPVMVYEKSQIILSLPLSENSDISYIPPQTTDAPFQQFLSVMQYDIDENISLYPVFCNMNGESQIRDYKFGAQCLPCDIDGNGHVELIIYIRGRNSLFSTCYVYRLVNNLPTQTFAVTPN